MPDDTGTLPPWPWKSGESKGDIIRRREDVSVGAWCLVRGTNRVYRRGPDGRSVGAPIARYSFEPQKVHGETRVSWLVGPVWVTEAARQTKVPKKDARAIYGLDDVEDYLWVAAHRFSISRHIENMHDIALLQRIAQIAGYNPERRDAR